MKQGNGASLQPARKREWFSERKKARVAGEFGAVFTGEKAHVWRSSGHEKSFNAKSGLKPCCRESKRRSRGKTMTKMAA